MHRFIEEASNPEPLCVHEFLEVLASLNYTLKQAESGGENAVKVLTMHASKGLEYPVVIIDDLSATYEGKNDYILHFDEEFGVCVKCMDKKSYTILDTVLWKYCTEKEKREEVKNELNVFYVALTRAKYRLHLLFSKEPQKYNTHYGRYYAEFVPKYVYDKYKCEDLLLPQTKRGIQPLVGKADEEAVNALRNLFLWQYPFHGGENLPVKTSASQRLKEEKEEYFPSAPLIKEDNGSGEGDATLIGLAYHAFLEHFDFYAHSVYGGGIENSLSKMKEAGVEEGYFALLQREKLEEIIRLPIFSEIAAKRLYKEQTFLVGLPAKEVYEPSQYGNMGEEEILFQGAIDLLAIGEEEATILDYKYSSAAADTLKRRYKLQLDLYRKTVAKLLHLPLNRVKAVIVNIQKGFSIEV
jgi:ATP-dependent helicase/nuclease subunit A